MINYLANKLRMLGVKDPDAKAAEAMAKLEAIESQQDRTYSVHERKALLNLICYEAYTHRVSEAITVPGMVVRLSLPEQGRSCYTLTLTDPLRVEASGHVWIRDGTINILQTQHGLKARFSSFPDILLFDAADIYPGDVLYRGKVEYHPILPASTLIYASA